MMEPAKSEYVRKKALSTVTYSLQNRFQRSSLFYVPQEPVRAQHSPEALREMPYSLYCSRECQKADWKSHKKSCGKQGPSTGPRSTGDSASAGSTSSANDPVVDSPFYAIKEKRFFDDKPEHEAFSQIIDSYRLRVEDEYKYMGEHRGIYNQEHPRDDFDKYLDKAEAKNVLPKWWNKETRRACVAYGFNSENWSDLECAVEKNDIIEHYGHQMMPMMPRMVAEMVEDSNVMGEKAGAGLQTLTSSKPGHITSMLDISGRGL